MIAKYYQIKSAKVVPADFPIRIVFISDLHNVMIGERNEVLLKKIDLLSPDLVLLGGDTIVAKPNMPMAVGLDLIKRLGERHRVYAANGNHEYRMRIYPDSYGEMYNDYQTTLEAAGIPLLVNDSVEVIVKETPIVIHGLELERKYYSRLTRHELEVAKMDEYLSVGHDESYHILLAHNPHYARTYMEWGADLTLCGHYHGGIIRLPKDRPLIGNDFQLFPTYAYGHHRVGERHLITSAGLGEHTIPLRINNPRELVVVDIVS